MARIMIENLFKKTILATDYAKSLLKHFQDNHLDWMHACGGKGRCTTCKVIVLEGEEFLESPTKAEVKYAREGALKPGERLACQACLLARSPGTGRQERIGGDVRLLVPKEYQLPHVRYSDDD
jgi:ferredoxin, 2Fe-2S